MGVPKSSLEWKFESKPFIYRSNIGDTEMSVAERTCCGKCGSNVILQYYLYPDKTHIAASTMLQNDFVTSAVGVHIWCKSVPSWHKIPDDNVPRFEEFDDDFQGKLDKYIEAQGKA